MSPKNYIVKVAYPGVLKKCIVLYEEVKETDA